MYTLYVILCDSDTATDIGSQSMISDPTGWDMLPDENTPLPGDKHYYEMRRKLRLAQDETLR